MPAGATLGPGAVPRRFARLGAFPQREIGGAALPLGPAAAVALDLVERTVGEFAVLAILRDVEVNVALRLVGVAAVDERLDDRDDLGHALGGAGKVIDLIDP